MTAINFPSTANTYPGLVYTSGGNSYVFDGVAWSLQQSSTFSSTPTFTTATITGALTAGSISLTGAVPWITSSGLNSTLTGYVTNSALTTALGGISSYSLPTATMGPGGTLGGVMVDGTTITIDGQGVIHGANTYTLPSATINQLGGVIVPAVGTSGLNNAGGTITLATASATQLGGVKIDGTTITINNGVISGYAGYTLPTATTSSLGGVIIPISSNSGLSNTSGTIRLMTASTSQLGGVRVDGSTITINGSGVISASITGAIVFQGGWSAATNSPTLANAGSAYNTNGYEFVVTAAGTVNFGAGNITFAVGDNVIFNGTSWIRVPIGSSSGVTNNALTFNTSGGVASGSSFNGSASITVDYSTIGASPLAGSTNLITVGTIGTGVWNGTLISPTYGGTGVNNGAYTLTLTGGNRTLNQDVSSGSSPTFTGTNFTSIPNAALSNSSITIGSTSVSLGGTVSAINGVPIGAVSANSGSFTSLSASGVVSGSGFSTYLASPPAIGGTTAAAGAFTTLSASSVSGAGFSTYLASPPTIGGTTPGLVYASTLIIGSNGIIFSNQPTPTALTATATLTIAQLLTQIVTVTSASAVSLTLPTGALTDAGILSGALLTNDAFDWYIINLGSSSGAVTMVAGTSHTYVGNVTVAITSTAHFRTRKTGASTYVTYRLS
jgi:hypothetical protein